MNCYIDVDLIKAHLNIDLDYCDEDEYLVQLAEVAIVAVENHIDRPIETVLDIEGNLPEPLKFACLLIIGTWYANRESVTYGVANKIPHSYEYLLNPYINYDESWKFQSEHRNIKKGSCH